MTASDIHLNDLFSAYLRYIFNAEAYAHYSIFVPRRKIGINKLRIRKSVPEREQNRLTISIEITIANVQPFAVFYYKRIAVALFGGTSDKCSGKVSARRPLGFTLPASTAAIAFAEHCPPKPPHTTASTLSIQAVISMGAPA